MIYEAEMEVKKFSEDVSSSSVKENFFVVGGEACLKYLEQAEKFSCLVTHSVIYLVLPPSY